MDVPINATAVSAEAFFGLSIVIETRWGPSPPITPNIGFVQGSVSGPEQAKPAQSPILPSGRSARHVTAPVTDGKCVQPVSSTTHSIMGTGHRPWLSSCAISPLEVLQQGSASLDQSLPPSLRIGKKPSDQLGTLSSLPGSMYLVGIFGMVVSFTRSSPQRTLILLKNSSANEEPFGIDIHLLLRILFLRSVGCVLVPPPSEPPGTRPLLCGNL